MVAPAARSRQPGGVSPCRRRRWIAATALGLGLGGWVPSLAAVPALRPQDSLLTPARQADLLAELQRADGRNRPQMRRLPGPGGALTITYRRPSEDPPLSVTELRRLIKDPPTYTVEREVILRLLQSLRRLGVTLVLGPPRRSGAMAEWEPKRAVLRIRPDAPGRGTPTFARILNHESIHVAQSCRAGRLRALPVPLGLPRPATPALDRQLSHPVYAGASANERIVEQEAYANHNRLELALTLLARHCRGLDGHTEESESGASAGALAP